MFYQRVRPWKWPTTIEFVAQWCSIALLFWFILRSPPATIGYILCLSSLPLLWIMLRRGLPDTLIAIAVLGAALAARIVWLPPPLEQWLQWLTFLSALSVAVLVPGVTVAQSRRTAASLRTQQDRLRRILDNLPVLVAYVDGQERYQFNNRGYQTWFGRSSKELTGSMVVSVIGEAAYRSAQPEIRLALSGHTVTFIRSVPYQTAGERRVRVTYTPDCDFDGTVQGFVGTTEDITEHKQLEQQLADALALNQITLEAASVGVLVYTASGECVHADQAAATIVGGSCVELLEQNFYELESWRRCGMLDMAKQVLTTGTPQRQEFNYVSTFGKEFWLDCRAAPLTANAMPHLLLVIDDTSARKRTEHELARYGHHLEELVHERTLELTVANAQLQREIAERIRAEEEIRYQADLLRNVSDAIVGTDLSFRINSWNPAAKALYGWDADEVMGILVSEAMRTEYVHDQPEQVRKQFFEQGIWQGEVIQNHKSGGRVHILSSVSRVRNSSGDPIGFVGVNRDITDRKRIEEQLTILSRAVEQSPISITITDTDGAISYADPRFTQQTGFTLDEVHGKRPRILDAGPQPEEARQIWQAIKTGTEWRGELQNTTKTGEAYWDYGVVAPIVDQNGHVTHIVAVMEDITQLKQQEREQAAMLAVATTLREVRDRSEMLSVILQQVCLSLDAARAFLVVPHPTTGELIVEAAHEDGQFQSDPASRIATYASVCDQVCQTGRPYVTADASADLLFANSEMLVEEQAAALVPLLTHETAIGLFWVARRSPFTDSDVRLLTAIADMTATGLQRAVLHEQTLRYAANLEQEVAVRTCELLEANKRLQELDRLKSKFVSDVSHELRTPVTNVGLYLQLFDLKPEKREHYLMVLREQASRLETLVTSVLDLARLDNTREIALAPVNVDEVLASVVTAQAAGAEVRNLTLTFQPSVGSPWVLGDRPKLVQVVTNLVTNALNYTPAGHVRVRSRPGEVPGTVQFEVEDTGVGIYPEDLPHLFERFYRGRRDQVADVPGTGLGLVIVKELIDLHGGSICVHSGVGAGSTFTVTLPAAPSGEK